ncbi:ImmA/IrrE family metallo-endopeptidase [Thermodesulfobacteriota bacterium]
MNEEGLFEEDAIEELRALVSNRAGELIRKTARRLPDWDPPPFDPALLAETLDIRITQSNRLKDCDALLVPIPKGGFRILCNSLVRSEGRKRFSIAHEIAHTFLPNARVICQMRTELKDRYYTSDSARKAERLCDLGAVELLMPRGFFLCALSELGYRASAVPELSDRFAVSREAAALRLVELSPGPCAVGFFQHTLRPSVKHSNAGPEDSVPGYRVTRFFRSKGFPFLLPQGKSIPRGSVIYKSSFGKRELRATEAFSLGRRQCTLQVSAFPLPGKIDSDSPPTVCAVFEAGGKNG